MATWTKFLSRKPNNWFNIIILLQVAWKSKTEKSQWDSLLRLVSPIRNQFYQSWLTPVSQRGTNSSRIGSPKFIKEEPILLELTHPSFSKRNQFYQNWLILVTRRGTNSSRVDSSQLLEEEPILTVLSHPRYSRRNQFPQWNHATTSSFPSMIVLRIYFYSDVQHLQVPGVTPYRGSQ